MRNLVLSLFGGASAVTLASASVATAQPVTTSPEPAASLSEDVIVVTARRRDESIQDVPAVVNPVTAETIQSLNIRRLEDISSLVPGLTLTSGTTGYTNMASVRGVTFDIVSSATPTVEFYLNDAPVDSVFLFQAFFDIGQLEVLRGPQGTLRGRAAPSGAITLTTRAPDMDAVGGYVSGTANDIGTYNLQGAVGIPIISDKLALRVAAIYDENEVNRVRSANSLTRPTSQSKAVRATLRFTPDDNLDARLTYQYIDRDQLAFDPVIGSGGPGGIVPGTSFPAPPAGYNGPVIMPGERLGITDMPRDTKMNYELLVGSIKWNLGGHALNYVGSYTDMHSVALRDQDAGNAIPDFSYFQTADGKTRNITQELRLSSEEPLFGGLLDYTAGVFYAHSKGSTDVFVGPSFLAGAFGSPLAPPVLGPPNTRFSLETLNLRDQTNEELSFFASVTAHLTNRTELTLGGRLIDTRFDAVGDLSTTAGVNARGGLSAAQCTAARGTLGTTYANVCDIPVAARLVQRQVVAEEQTPFVYNATLSHRFTDELMVYAGVGTSWRRGPAVVGLTNGRNDPVLNSLTFLSPEKSTSYELGFKSSLFDDKLRFNATVYHQKFDGFIFRGTPAGYLSDSGSGAASVSNFSFTSNADAKVTGVDADIWARISPEWTISANFSYAKGKISNDFIPCNDGNFDGIPDGIAATVGQFQTAGRFVNFCRSNGSTSRAPTWSATAQTEYVVPITAGMEIVGRGLFNYFPKNPNRSIGFVADNYALINLFAGLRSSEGDWEATLFVKNLTNAKVMTSRDNVQLTSAGGVTNFFGQSGYYQVDYTAPREFGITLNYAFGSR